jgi:hypothetical protein
MCGGRGYWSFRSAFRCATWWRNWPALSAITEISVSPPPPVPTRPGTLLDDGRRDEPGGCSARAAAALTLSATLSSQDAAAALRIPGRGGGMTAGRDRTTGARGGGALAPTRVPTARVRQGVGCWPGRRASRRGRISTSLPWIGALPPCPPAMMQAGSLLGSTSNGASLGGHVTIRPMDLHPRGSPCPVRAVKHEWASSWGPALRRRARHSLDSQALVPYLRHSGPGDQASQ